MARQRVARPKTKILRGVYRELISASLAVRLAALSRALAWFDDGVGYVMDRGAKLTTDQQKSLVTATKARSHGISTPYNEEKETAFCIAIKSYEKVVVRLHPPALKKQYEILEERRQRLESRQEKLSRRYDVLRVLTVCLQPRTAEGKDLLLFVADNLQGERQADPALSHMVYSRTSADRLRKMLRKDGLLAVVVRELPFISRISALVPDGQGGYGADLALQVAKTQEMLNHFLAFCRTETAPKRLVRFGIRDEGTAEMKSQGEVRRGGFVGGPRQGRVKVGGLYMKGSSIGTLYEMLADGQVHEKEALRKLVSANLESRLVAIQKDGVRHGRWKLDLHGATVQMTVV